jgi:hypothetical protein
VRSDAAAASAKPISTSISASLNTSVGTPLWLRLRPAMSTPKPSRSWTSGTITSVSARLPGIPASAPRTRSVSSTRPTPARNSSRMTSRLYSTLRRLSAGVRPTPPETSISPSPLSSSRTTTSARTRLAVSAAAIWGRSRS